MDMVSLCQLFIQIIEINVDYYCHRNMTDEGMGFW